MSTVEQRRFGFIQSRPVEPELKFQAPALAPGI